jgi:hypothetical protein
MATAAGTGDLVPEQRPSGVLPLGARHGVVLP